MLADGQHSPILVCLLLFHFGKRGREQNAVTGRTGLSFTSLGVQSGHRPLIMNQESWTQLASHTELLKCPLPIPTPKHLHSSHFILLMFYVTLPSRPSVAAAAVVWYGAEFDFKKNASWSPYYPKTKSAELRHSMARHVWAAAQYLGKKDFSLWRVFSFFCIEQQALGAAGDQPLGNGTFLYQSCIAPPSCSLCAGK